MASARAQMRQVLRGEQLARFEAILAEQEREREKEKKR